MNADAALQSKQDYEHFMSTAATKKAHKRKKDEAWVELIKHVPHSNLADELKKHSFTTCDFSLNRIIWKSAIIEANNWYILAKKLLDQKLNKMGGLSKKAKPRF